MIMEWIKMSVYIPTRDLFVLDLKEEGYTCYVTMSEGEKPNQIKYDMHIVAHRPPPIEWKEGLKSTKYIKYLKRKVVRVNDIPIINFSTKRGIGVKVSSGLVADVSSPENKAVPMGAIIWGESI